MINEKYNVGVVCMEEKSECKSLKLVLNDWEMDVSPMIWWKWYYW